MADDSMLTGYLAGQSDNNNNGWANDGGWLWILVIFALLGFGGNGFGGRNGGGNGGENVTVVPYPTPSYGMGFSGGALTQADLCSEFNFNNLTRAVGGIQQGVCDSTYALNNAITSGTNTLQMAVMQGFNGVDRAMCNQGYQTQAGFNALGNQLASCCCETKSAIGDVKYQMATDTCAIQTSIRDVGRDIIDNQNANYRGLMDFMVQRDMDALRAENQTLKLAASQANQNNVIGARIDAATAEILRRTGAECPTAAYIVQPPTPVNFPVNNCGQFAGWNNGCGNGCGSCC